MPKRRQLLVCCAALLAAGLWTGGSTATARTPRTWRPPPPPLVSLSVVDGHGAALSAVTHRGQTFVAGARGDRYEVELRNNTAERLEVVLSVDGRDAVSGELADFRKARGYVLAPFGVLAIDGFRTSLDTVAAFRFSDPQDSFTGRNGTPQHAGVIAVAVFKERRAPMRRHHRPRSTAPRTPSGSPSAGKDAAPSATPRRTGANKGATKKSRRAWQAPRTEQQLGTAFGERRQSRVREVSFVRASAQTPALRTTIRYDSAHALADRGVPGLAQPMRPRRPVDDAWPGAVDSHFAKPPPPRRR